MDATVYAAAHALASPFLSGGGRCERCEEQQRTGPTGECEGERNHAKGSIFPRVSTSRNGQPTQPHLACLHPIETQLRATRLINVTNYHALIRKADELWLLILR